jgi:hypothetical protein
MPFTEEELRKVTHEGRENADLSEEDNYLLEAAMCLASMCNDEGSAFVFADEDLVKFTRCALNKDFSPIYPNQQKSFLMDFGQALAAMKEGKKVAHSYWGDNDPAYLVFVPGRDVKASFRPMVNHLGEGTTFRVQDHIDAVFVTPLGRGKGSKTSAAVGYQFSQQELLVPAWILVD